MGQELSLKERRFVDALVSVANGNATEAARVAGYSDPNANGARIAVRNGIQAEIARRTAMESITAERVLAELATIALADPGDYQGLVGLKDPAEIRAEMERLRAAGKTRPIKKLSMGRGGLQVELADKGPALQTLAKCLGMLTTRISLSAELDWESLSDQQLKAIADGREL